MQAIIKTGFITEKCDCGKCPGWLSENIGKWMAMVEISNGHIEFVGPFESESWAKHAAEKYLKKYAVNNLTECK